MGAPDRRTPASTTSTTTAGPATRRCAGAAACLGSAVLGRDHPLPDRLRTLGDPAEGRRPVPARPRLRVSGSRRRASRSSSSVSPSTRRGSRSRRCGRSTPPGRWPPAPASSSTLPLHFSGVDPPSARDLRRPREIVVGVALILGFTAAGVLWFFAREHRYGRFAPLTTAIDETWLAEHIFKYPAEVVAAAWDENVGTAEVTSLIARMVDDGKLRSSVGKGTAKSAEMTLHLLVDRASPAGARARAGRQAVRRRRHRDQHQDRARTLQEDRVHAVGRDRTAVEGRGRCHAADRADRRGASRCSPRSLMALGLLLIAWSGSRATPARSCADHADAGAHRRGLGRGLQVSRLPPLGIREALLCLLPVLAIGVGASLYLWFYAGTGRIELPPLTVIGVVAVTLALHPLGHQRAQVSDAIEPRSPSARR